MALQAYRQKRRFEKTPEPRGKARARRGALRFVVQKHHARRLHYDLRLEVDGVLKSWAVPKGPSMNPADKRLAVMVEDHPLDYGGFEGTIPEGNYGAGSVIIWDRGTYEPIEANSRAEDEKRILEELSKGHVRLTLHGEKLRGGFSLIRLKRGKENDWMLIKRRDEFADGSDVLADDRSVKSGRTVEELGNGRAGAAKKERKRTARTAKRPPAKSAMPHRIKPMLATLVDKPFDREGWIFEIKWDGYRAIAEIENGDVQLYSRNFISYDKRFPTIVRALQQFGHDVVLDGEIAALDSHGKSQFQLLQNYQRTGKGTIVYFVFDLLYLDGRDLRSLPLLQRKLLLAPLVNGKREIRMSEHVVEAGTAFYKAAVDQGLEGMMAKNGDSPYREGARSWDWLKLKSRQRQEAVIGGFTAPRGARKKLGALVLGVYQGRDLVYVGHSGSGFDEQSLDTVHDKLKPLVQPECPFRVKPKTNMPVQWVKPALVCDVAFQEWTSDGIMRQPIFQGLREDKKPASVVRELPEHAPASDRAETKHSALPKGEFTNLDKVYWPAEGITKGDLLHYYHEVAPVMLAHLRDRPMVLHRHPNGITGESFFQKDVTRNRPPEWVQTKMIRSESDRKETRYLICRDEATLLYMANLGCIEMNPWTSRIEHLDNPDYAIIDLDPQDVEFSKVIETAKRVRELLESCEIECYCKTSGKRGLHIYVPLGARYTHDIARQFAETVAWLVHAKLPSTTSLIRDPAQRRNRVYLDYLQNAIGKSTAAAYSVRPVPGACVAAPLRWQEVSRRLDPARFTIRTMPRRLDEVGDLWKPTLGNGVDLEAALQRLQKRFARARGRRSKRS